ncbi:MAG: hypothetical protein WBW34_10205, partial [Nitrososphaeraceae archaeon]
SGEKRKMKNRKVIEHRVKMLKELTGLDLVIDAYTPGDRYGTRIRLAERMNEAGGISNIGMYTLGASNFNDMLDTMIQLFDRVERKKQNQ